MEWMNRGARPAQAGQPNTNAAPVGSSQASSTSHSGGAVPGGRMRWMVVALLFAGAALTVAVIAMLAFGGRKEANQGQFVDTKKMQAVFLNGGQVYFGNITDLNSQFLRMGNIYYLRVNQQVQPNGESSSNQDISLVKLGCELHGPQDSMVINQDQVIFWENLKDDGQVAKAVKTYREQNPNGQQCNTNTTTNSNSNSTSTSNSSNSTSTNKKSN